MEVDIAGGHGVGQFVSRVIENVVQSYIFDSPDYLKFNLYWSDYTPKRFYYHQDDEETSQEKCEFLLKQLNFNCKIDVEHHYISETDSNFIYAKKNVSSLEYDDPLDIQHIKYFKNKLNVKNKKVCFWRWDESDNSKIRYFNNKVKFIYDRKGERIEKINIFSESEWDSLEQFLSDNFYVVRLFYRMPIREVMYHLSTCEFSIGYSGMYHSLTTRLGNAHISLFHHEEDHLLQYKLNGKYINKNFMIYYNHIHSFEHMLNCPDINKILNKSYFNEQIKLAELKKKKIDDQ